MGPNDFQDNIRHANSRDTSIRLPGGSDAPTSAGLLDGAALGSRLKARLFAGRLDREVEVGIVPLPGSSLAVHIARLTSVEEREALARTMREALSELRRDRRGLSAQIPVHPERLAELPRCDRRHHLAAAFAAPGARAGHGPAAALALRRDRAAVPQRAGQSRRRAPRRLPPSRRSGQQHRGARDAPLGQVEQGPIGLSEWVFRRGDLDVMAAREVQELRERRRGCSTLPTGSGAPGTNAAGS